MASSSSIRAGQAYIELLLKDNQLVRGLAAAQKRLDGFAKSINAAGLKLMAGGAALSAPILGSIRGFASFEQALADLRAAANPTEEQFAKLRGSILRVSQSTGQGPTAVTMVFSELLKAGMSAELVMGGAAEASIRFARVGGIDVAAAATVLNDALNVFVREGLSAEQVVDILSKSADASSISIEQVTQAFSQSAAVFGMVGLGMNDLASAIGILGNAGVKGSDAGTSLKTMLLRLTTGAESAGTTMRQLGISVRDAHGNVLPMREIIAELQEKLAGLDQAARQQALYKLFGSDAIRAGAILLEQGAAGWDAFQEKLAGSLPVAQKFEQMNNTLLGSLGHIRSALERAAVAVGEILQPAIARTTRWIERIVGGLAEWVSAHRQIIVVLAATAFGTFADSMQQASS